MVVLHKDSDDSTVLGPSSDFTRWCARRVTATEFLPKRLVNGFPSQFSPMAPETSFAWVGSGRARMVARLRPDVVQLHWISGGLIRPQGLRALADYPLVWRLSDMWPFSGTEHYVDDHRYVTGYDKTDPYPGHRGPDLDRWVWRRKRAAYERLSDLTLVAPSKWMAACAKRSSLFRDHRVEVIPTGVDTSKFSARGKTEARARLGWDPSAPVLLFGGVSPTSNPRKGFAELRKALWILQTRGKLPTVCVFGSGIDSSDLGIPVTSLGVLDHGDLPEVYAAADVLVAPSLQENLANIVLEALACGIPVVAFDVGGMSDAIAHRRNGYLAKDMNPSDLALGVEWVLGLSPEERSTLSRAARATATNRFDRGLEVKAYLELYNELIRERRGKKS